MDEKLLDIQDLSVWYKTYRGFAEVVDHINLYVVRAKKSALWASPAAERPQR